MIWLPDGNVLVALVLDSHVHHDRAHRWFASVQSQKFATCVLTQGTLLRAHMRTAADPGPDAAWRALASVIAHPRHVWWGNEMGFADVPHRHLQGPHQVTDAWLAELARRHRGKIATLDIVLATLHSDVALLLPP